MKKPLLLFAQQISLSDTAAYVIRFPPSYDQIRFLREKRSMAYPVFVEDLFVAELINLTVNSLNTRAVRDIIGQSVINLLSRIMICVGVHCSRLRKIRSASCDKKL